MFENKMHSKKKKKKSTIYIKKNISIFGSHDMFAKKFVDKYQPGTAK